MVYFNYVHYKAVEKLVKMFEVLGSRRMYSPLFNSCILLYKLCIDLAEGKVLSLWQDVHNEGEEEKDYSTVNIEASIKMNAIF